MRRLIVIVSAAVVVVAVIYIGVTMLGKATTPAPSTASSTPYETNPRLKSARDRTYAFGKVGGSAQKRPSLGEKLGLGGDSGASGGSGGSSGSGGGGFKVPQNIGGLLLLILSVVLIVGGSYLIKKDPPNLPWGFGSLIVGIVLLMFQMGVAGLNFNLNPANWSKTGLIVWLILVACWTVSKLTGFTKIDDYVVTLGSIGMLVLSLVGGGLLGQYNPFTTQWWILELLWIFLIAEAILKGLAARRTLQILLLIAGWYALGVIS